MCQAVLSPNLTKKFQWEVSQIADNRFPCVTLLGGLSVNLNHLKSTISILQGMGNKQCCVTTVTNRDISGGIAHITGLISWKTKLPS